MRDGANRPRRRKLALITDASSNNGAAFARYAASKGLDVALVARDEKHLHALTRVICTEYSATAHMFRADPRNVISTADICRWITSRNLSVDVLINNAGFGRANSHAGHTAQLDLDDLPFALTAPILLTYHCLPGMLARRWGRIINVCPNTPTAFDAEGVTQRAINDSVATFYHALNAEVSGKGVTISSVGPEASGMDLGSAIDAGTTGTFYSSKLKNSLEAVESQHLPAMLPTTGETARANSLSLAG